MSEADAGGKTYTVEEARQMVREIVERRRLGSMYRVTIQEAAYEGLREIVAYISRDNPDAYKTRT